MQEIDYDKLAAAIAEKLHAMPAQENVLWDANDCAAYLSVSAQHFTDRISKTYGFPAGTPLPSDAGTGKRAHKRWYATEVQTWWRNRNTKQAS